MDIKQKYNSWFLVIKGAEAFELLVVWATDKRQEGFRVLSFPEGGVQHGLFRVELNQLFQGSLADRTEGGSFVDLHATLLRSAVNAF